MIRWITSLLLGLTLLASCTREGGPTAASSNSASASSSPVSQTLPKRYGLGISGYNYTNTAIESFSVSYAGGDTLSVSTPTSGGSHTVCCVSLWLPLTHTPTLNVQWWRNGKTCEINVPLNLPVPPEPKTMAVHFHEDGHVEVEASADVAPSPRLKLERYSEVRRHKDDALNVVNDERFAKCTDGYR